MRERVAPDGGWPMPYLRAEQPGGRTRVWRQDDAGLLRDRRGRADRVPRRPGGDHQDLSLNAAWLREALDAVLAGSEPDGSETEPVGCSIKWKR